MGELIELHLTTEGDMPGDLHIHLTLPETEHDSAAILARLTSMENTMSDLSNAVTALQDRISVDITELQRQLGEKDALLQEALASDAADASTIADLNARNDALNTEIGETVTRLGTIDPLSDFPAVEQPPADEPPVDQPPADGGPQA